MSAFVLNSPFRPAGDQPRAIETLAGQLHAGRRHNVLLGVTGSGKTYTMAQVINREQRPALIIAPNKTLAAQLYNEFKQLFPQSAVEYFVSYYDYYQPEAYLPSSDTYIQKDSSINDMIDKLRHSATRSVLSRRDVLVVASVSCIFGLGAPEDYLSMRVSLANQDELVRDELLRNLVTMHYERNDTDFHRGVFRVRGDRVEIFPAYEEDCAIRIEFFGDEIESIAEIDPLRGEIKRQVQNVTIFPASHYVTTKTTQKAAIQSILTELKGRIKYFQDQKKFIEAQRIEERTNFDLEMLQELGYCNGIENYSRHLTDRSAGDPPPTLLDYFAEDFVVFLDESHIAVPQLIGMYRGDRSRKTTLVEYGFRLPSALDNRPLQFEEFKERVNQVVYVSATPGDYEIEQSKGAIIELIARPTGLIDPVVEVRSAKNQVDDLHEEILQCCQQQERVLVTTLTKRMAEDLTEYFADLGIRVRYLHAEIDTLERIDIIRNLRLGQFDVLVGINLLREGLDIPEVSLVAILDADKEGYLRSTRSLIQTFGRASRNINGKVILYGDRVTRSMQAAIEETNRRRTIQQSYNQTHNITPKGITKAIVDTFESLYSSENKQTPHIAENLHEFDNFDSLDGYIKQLQEQMERAVKALEFERAAEIRDQIRRLKKRLVLET